MRQLNHALVVAISSRALFDLEESHAIYETQGVEAYQQYQIAHENTPLPVGSTFHLVTKLLNLNQGQNQPLVEVILLSRNSADTGLRVFNSIKHYGLNITRAVFSNGQTPYPYISAFGAHLFLSADPQDVRAALQAGYAAAQIVTNNTHSVDVSVQASNPPGEAPAPFHKGGERDLHSPLFEAPTSFYKEENHDLHSPLFEELTSFYKEENRDLHSPLFEVPTSFYKEENRDLHSPPLRKGAAASAGGFNDVRNKQLRIAFDGDAVLFSDEAERIYQQHNLAAFNDNEIKSADQPLTGGPFKPVLAQLAYIQSLFPAEDSPIRTALVTARSAPAHERVIKTLRAWNIRIDEALFLGGLNKSEFLRAFDADVFFDDHPIHIEDAKQFVTTGHVLHGVLNE